MADNDKPYKLRTYLAVRTMMESNCTIFEAIEAVSSTAMEHPEWPDLDKELLWSEWIEWEKELANARS